METDTNQTGQARPAWAHVQKDVRERVEAIEQDTGKLRNEVVDEVLRKGLRMPTKDHQTATAIVRNINITNNVHTGDRSVSIMSGWNILSNIRNYIAVRFNVELEDFWKALAVATVLVASVVVFGITASALLRG